VDGVPGNFRLGRNGVVSTAVVAPCVTLKSSKLALNEVRSGDGVLSVSSNLEVDTSPDLEVSGMGLSASPSPSSMLAVGQGGEEGGDRQVKCWVGLCGQCCMFGYFSSYRPGGARALSTHTPLWRGCREMKHVSGVDGNKKRRKL
jgi:hypothetical protein